MLRDVGLPHLQQVLDVRNAPGAIGQFLEQRQTYGMPEQPQLVSRISPLLYVTHAAPRPDGLNIRILECYLTDYVSSTMKWSVWNSAAGRNLSGDQRIEAALADNPTLQQTL
jgi:hypothetical protein